MKQLFNFLYFLLLLVGPAHASEIVTDLYTWDKSGEAHKIKVFEYINDWGNKEIRLEAQSAPNIVKGFNPILGYGRDLDDDNKIESWFMIHPDWGIKRFIFKGNHPSGHDVIQLKLFKEYESASKMHLQAAMGSVLSYLFISINNSHQNSINFYKRWMDLDEYFIRLQREMNSDDKTLTPEHIDESLEMLIQGYDENIKMIERNTGTDFWSLAVADIGIWAAGGAVLKWIGKGFSYIGVKISSNSVVSEIKVVVDKFAEKLVGRAKKRIVSIKSFEKKVVNTSLKVASATWTKTRHQITYRGGILAMKIRNQLKNKIMPFGKKLAGMGKAGLLEWKYIGLNMGIQVTSETFAHASEVVDDGPIETAKNVLSHPDIQQNISYMATNTFLMTAANSSIKKTQLRYAACGFIALSNSGITNFVIKESDNYKRVAVDTGWEALVGSSQVMLDLTALSYFEKLAVKKGNARLKLLGYAVVMIDQGIGYFAYSKATSAIDPKESQPIPIQLVPIMVEDE